ncbi:hypothetical protein CYY_001640 [Polysphondylium violaceum]|uniref:F-box/LRR-repeat protein 15-like leucin rich repeat domain-containing protein n=1 Tax=Polysphondylium violaceum TaxID=133409 RepID=A0A8J4PXZ7_9MYCE|nr:hypothetical protein CYY_001640 [Polysphondylium violaceum]
MAHGEDDIIGDEDFTTSPEQQHRQPAAPQQQQRNISSLDEDDELPFSNGDNIVIGEVHDINDPQPYDPRNALYPPLNFPPQPQGHQFPSNISAPPNPYTPHQQPQQQQPPQQGQGQQQPPQQGQQPINPSHAPQSIPLQQQSIPSISSYPPNTILPSNPSQSPQSSQMPPMRDNNTGNLPMMFQPPPYQISSPYENVNIVYQNPYNQSPPPLSNIPIDADLMPNYTPDHLLDEPSSFGIGSIVQQELLSLKDKLINNLYIKPQIVNQIDDESLNSISECKGLLYLNLSSCNNFSKVVFNKAIGKLPNLKAINLSNCSQIVDDNIKTLAKSCKNLEEVHLNGCVQITDESISFLVEKCTKIKILSLSKCEKLTDKSIVSISNKLNGLTSLCINHIKYITQSSLPTLKKFNMKSFYAYNTLLTDPVVFETVPKWGSHLEVLNLGKCTNLVDNSISAIAFNCPNIKKLFLQSCKGITGLSINLIAQKCTQLNTLRVDYCTNLMDDAVVSLENLKCLKILNLSGLLKINELSLIRVLPRVPELEELYLYDCPRFSDLTVNQLCKSNPNLKVIRIDGTFFPTDESLCALSQACTALRTVNLSGLLKITDRTLFAFGNYQKYLQKLYLNGCKFIGNDSLYCITNNLFALEALRLDNSFQFSEDSLNSLGKLHNLKTLNISGCTHATNRTADIISFSCKQLTHLYLWNLPQLTSNCLPSLLINLPRLKLLRVDGCINIVMNGAISFPQKLCLEVFNCSETGIGYQTINSIASNCWLKELYCWGCENVTDDGLKELANHASNLSVLRIDRCKNISDKGARLLVQKTPLLSILNISNTNCGEDTINAVATYCKLLKKLYCFHCPKVVDRNIGAIAFQCQFINTINLSKCTNISDTGVIELSKCKFLKKVNLSYCSKITNASIIKLSLGCPMLKEILLKECVNVGEIGILSISTYCKRLESLDVSMCPNVTELAIVGIGRECLLLNSLEAMGISGKGNIDNGVIEVAVRSNINLKNLNLSNTHTSDKSIQMLVRMCPSLRTLNLVKTDISDTIIPLIYENCRLLKDFKH